jgi:hypothetical protein
MTELVIKQDAKLNPHVIDMQPITWRQRWEWAKQGLFVTPFCFWVCAILTVNLWMEDKPVSLLPMFAGFLILSALSCLGVVVLLEWRHNYEKKSPRKLVCDADRIILHKHRPVRLSWKLVEGWHLSSLPDDSALMKLTLIYRPFAQAKNFRQWSIVLTKATQTTALLELLEIRNLTKEPGARLLTELPACEQPQLTSLMALYISAFGGIIMIPASLLLIAGVAFLRSDDARLNHALAEPVAGNFNNLVVNLIERCHSTHEFAWALLVGGLVCLLAGFLLFRIGGRQLDKQPLH